MSTDSPTVEDLHRLVDRMPDDPWARRELKDFIARQLAAEPRPIAGDRQMDSHWAVSTAPEVVDGFVARAGRLPQMRRILLETSDDGICIWSVIEAPPFSRSEREQVYAAELDALDGDPEAEVDFRLINHSEYGAEQLAGVLPKQARVLWER